MQLVSSALLLLSVSMTTVSAAELSSDDLTKCHHYSSLAAKYQIAKQQGKTLEQALENVDNPNERILANKVYKEIDHNYNVAEIRKELFKQCAKSFAEYRDNEINS